jgi:putative ABC transport system permease protein
MIQNFFKVAIRYLLRNKGYTAINILGLAIGITCCTLIMLFVRNEFSYDKFHDKSDRIYRSWVREKYQGQQDIVDILTPLPLAGALRASFPEIESTVRVLNFNILVKVEQNSFSDNVVMVDSSFFNIFDFQLLIGDRKNPFPLSTSIILTEETAKKYFGKSDPIGKTIELPFAGDSIPFTVSGIAKSAPEESSIKFNALISFENENIIFLPRTLKNWFNVNPETYVLLKKGVDPHQLEAKFPSMVKQHLGADYKEGMYLVNLQPLKKIHLDTSLPAGIQPISDPKYSYILLTIGILILLVACINFITLSIGRSATRALEVGVRKVLGSGRHQLTRQFWGEAILLTLISVIIGIILAFLLVKPFSQIINRQLVLHVDLIFLTYCFLITLVIGLIAGIYPALILSGFKPIEVLKGKLKIGSNPGWLHRSLISGQFIASITMIICTVVIGRQLYYLQHKDLGHNKENVVIVSTNKPRIVGTELARIYRNELLKYPQVKQATYSAMSFAESPWIQVGFTDDKKIYRDFQFNAVDPEFVKTMGLQIVQGRDFSNDNPVDQLGSMIVNESLVKMFGWKDPIGQKLSDSMEQQIIGVVKDFHFQSLHTKIQPLVMVVKPDSFYRRIENFMY